MSVQNLAPQRNAIDLQNSGLTPRIETLDVVLRQKKDKRLIRGIVVLFLVEHIQCDSGDYFPSLTAVWELFKT